MSTNEIFTFITGAAIGGLLSWLITHIYALQASREQALQLKQLSEELKPKNTLDAFAELVDNVSWQKEVIGGNELWIAETDNTFQIEVGERSREFQERWTTVYPDRNSAAYPVYLNINGNVVKELTFISMDGGRIFVPMPELRPAGDATVEFFWNLNSLGVKVSKIVGVFYIHENLAGIARLSNIALVE